MTDCRTHSVFWHQYTRQKFDGPATFITDTVLSLDSGTVVALHANLVLTFMINGLTHGIIELSAGISWRNSGAFTFFCAQALGVILEDSMQAIYRHMCGTQRESGPPQRWIRMMGYVWVLTFVVWSTPAWFYQLLTREPKYKPLPFSLILFLTV